MASLVFPILVLAVSIVAYLVPGPFAQLPGLIVPLLIVIMFSMGLSLTVADFKRVVSRPKAVGLGLALQYAVMPLAALAIGTALGLPLEFVVGMVLVGCSPGGTASNVMAYLARADVALSVTLTAVSSLAAVVLTPTLAWLLVGQSVPVAVGSMLGSVVQIVLLPIAAGVVINTFWGDRLDAVRSILPKVAIAAILVIIAVIVALNRDELAEAGALILLGAFLQNVTGLVAGYSIARVLGFDRTVARTISIEVGMQNSGLAVALALKYFSAAAALPGAIFSIVHNITGAAVAGHWSRLAAKQRTEEPPTGIADR